MCVFPGCRPLPNGSKRGNLKGTIGAPEYHYSFFRLTILLFLQFKWRNGWFYSLSEKAIAAGKPDPCPLHTSWLKELKVV